MQGENEQERKESGRNSTVHSLVVQWLGLGAFIAKSPGLIFGQGAKIPLNHKAQPKKKKKNLRTIQNSSVL